MSRSYKHFPVVKDKNPGMKKIANRKFRRSNKFEDVPMRSHGYYRKCSETYDLCDWIYYLSKECFQKDFLDDKHYIQYICHSSEEEEAKIWYKKHFICK